MSFDPIDHDFERGMARRRAILGDAWVDKSVGNANNFSGDFQAMITRFAWNEVWNRPGLEARTRRVIVLAITVALGRWEEFALHLRAALTGDADTRLTPDEVKEVLIQAAIYAGVPAANTAFTHAQKILHEIGADIGYALEPVTAAALPRAARGTEGRSTGTPSLHFDVRLPRNRKAARHTVVLSHALGCDLTMWDALATRLAADCRVITYDHPGHGSSDALTGAPSIADLADGAAQLLRQLDSGPVVWIGLSMGGMVGQELALRHPTLVSALVIANATSSYPEGVRQVWQERIARVSAGGIEAIADAVMERYFHADFRLRRAAVVARFRQRLLSTGAAGYAACCAAVASMDTTARLDSIAVPTLVIAGERDEGTPVAMLQALAEQIPGARMVVLADASHLSAVEQPEAFAEAVQAFIDQL